MVKLNIPIALISIIIIIFISCKSNQSIEEKKEKFVISDSLLKTLMIDSVVRCPLVKTLTLTGKVSFNDEKVIKIFPMVSGNIMDVNVQLGDYVKKGQRLGIIRSSEMAGYGNDVISARTNLIVAKKNFDASKDMYSSGLASQKDMVNAEAMYQQAQSQVNRSNRVLQINGGSMQGQFVLKAPISGFIVEKQITSNMAIRTDNTNSLFTISDLQNVWVLANVYESNINQVHLGDEVEVTTLSYPGRKFIGKIDKMLNVLDPTNKVMKIRVVLPNPNFVLKPEMFASVTVLSHDDHKALCIPSSALIFDHSQNYVLVYKSNSDVRIIPVQVINTNEDKTYISGGLLEGDKIISSDTILIYHALNS